jgi:hypothetical protein
VRSGTARSCGGADEGGFLPVQFNHLAAAAKDNHHSATFLKDLLGLPEPTSWGPFVSLTLDDGNRLDYAEPGASTSTHSTMRCWSRTTSSIVRFSASRPRAITVVGSTHTSLVEDRGDAAQSSQAIGDVVKAAQKERG